MAEAAKTNFATDPGFESGVLSYEFRDLESGVIDATSVVGDLGDPSHPDFAPIIDGDWSLRVKASANSSTGVIISIGKRVPTAVAQVWSAAVQAGFATAGMNARLTVGFQTAAGEDISKGDNTLLGPELLLGPKTLLGGTRLEAHADGLVAGTTPELLKVDGIVAPMEAAFVVVRLSLVANEEVAGSVTFDNVVLVQDEVAPEYPIDGDRGGMQWLGTRFFSASAELEESPVLADWRSWTPAYLWSPKVLSKELS